MSNNASSSSGGIGFLGALALLFIALKLTGYIDWSWWWVLAPIWIPFALLVVGGVPYIGVGMWRDHIRAKRRENARKAGGPMLSIRKPERFR